jgi:peroxiredoxin
LRLPLPEKDRWFRAILVSSKSLAVRRESLTSALLVASVAVNVGLAIQLDRIRAGAEPKPFLSGNTAPPLKLHSQNEGKEVVLTYSAETLPVLLYWFQPTCGWCEANFLNVKALDRQARGKYKFVAISSASPDELAEYARRKGVTFPMYSVHPQAAKLYRLNGTPASVLISRSGNLVKRWDGAYTPSMLTDIERTLSVVLPGLTVAGKEQQE